MLKGIPAILSPELLKVLCEMGHSDRIVISDGNFPAETMGKDAIVVRMDGHGVPEILDAILQVFPLDSYVENQYDSFLEKSGLKKEQKENEIIESNKITQNDLVVEINPKNVYLNLFQKYECVTNDENDIHMQYVKLRLHARQYKYNLDY